MTKHRLLISYLTAIASGLAAIITIFVYKNLNTDITNYALLISIMMMMFGYSVVLILLRPSSEKCSYILSEVHYVVHEIRSLVTANKVSEQDLSYSISRILKRLQVLFSALSGNKCNVSLMLIHDEDRLIRYSSSDEKKPFDIPVFKLSAYSSLLEGEKYYIGGIKENEVEYFRDNEHIVRFRSLAVFPISKTETIKLNERKRIVIGFLSIESNTSNAFRDSSGDNEDNMLFRTGFLISDALALLIPLFIKFAKDNNSQQ